MLPIRRHDSLSENTLNILSGVKEALAKKPQSTNQTPTSNNQVLLSEASLNKKFSYLGKGLYKEADDSNIGKIWFTKEIEDPETGTKQSWLVAYVDDNDELIKQISSKLVKEAGIVKSSSEPFAQDGYGNHLFPDDVIETNEGRRGTVLSVEDEDVILVKWDEGEDYPVRLYTGLESSLGIRKIGSKTASSDLDSFIGFTYTNKDDVNDDNKYEVYLDNNYIELIQNDRVVDQYNYPESNGVGKVQDGEEDDDSGVYYNEIDNFLEFFKNDRVIFTLFLNRLVKTASLKHQAATVNPKNIPLSPGIKSKNITMDETGGTQNAKVTIEFTDAGKGLDFYQTLEGVDTGKEVEDEVPEEVEGQQEAPPAPAQPAQPAQNTKQAPQPQATGMGFPAQSSLKSTIAKMTHGGLKVANVIVHDYGFSFINEDNKEVSLDWSHPLKIGSIFVRPDNGESVRLGNYMEVNFQTDDEDIIEDIVDMLVSPNDVLKGGVGDDLDIEDFDEEQVDKGKDVEKEHSNDEDIIEDIVKDHLAEDDEYYDKLEDIEKKKESSLSKIAAAEDLYSDTVSMIKDIPNVKLKSAYYNGGFSITLPNGNTLEVETFDSEGKNIKRPGFTIGYFTMTEYDGSNTISHGKFNNLSDVMSKIRQVTDSEPRLSSLNKKATILPTSNPQEQEQYIRDYAERIKSQNPTLSQKVDSIMTEYNNANKSDYNVNRQYESKLENLMLGIDTAASMKESSALSPDMSSQDNYNYITDYADRLREQYPEASDRIDLILTNFYSEPYMTASVTRKYESQLENIVTKIGRTSSLKKKAEFDTQGKFNYKQYTDSPFLRSIIRKYKEANGVEDLEASYESFKKAIKFMLEGYLYDSYFSEKFFRKKGLEILSKHPDLFDIVSDSFRDDNGKIMFTSPTELTSYDEDQGNEIPGVRNLPSSESSLKKKAYEEDLYSACFVGIPLTRSLSRKIEKDIEDRRGDSSNVLSFIDPSFIDKVKNRILKTSLVKSINVAEDPLIPYDDYRLALNFYVELNSAQTEMELDFIQDLFPDAFIEAVDNSSKGENAKSDTTSSLRLGSANVASPEWISSHLPNNWKNAPEEEIIYHFLDAMDSEEGEATDVSYDAMKAAFNRYKRETKASKGRFFTERELLSWNKTAADISDSVSPMGWTTQESNSAPSGAGPALPQQQSLQDQPDVLYDSNKDSGPKFQTTIDPKGKSVTVKFLDSDEMNKLDNAVDQSQQPQQQSNQPQTGQGALNLNFQNTDEFKDQDVPISY